jgi:hypothetical protein
LGVVWGSLRAGQLIAAMSREESRLPSRIIDKVGRQKRGEHQDVVLNNAFHSSSFCLFGLFPMVAKSGCTAVSEYKMSCYSRGEPWRSDSDLGSDLDCLGS